MNTGALCLLRGGEIMRFVGLQGEMIIVESLGRSGRTWVFAEDVLKEVTTKDNRMLFHRLADSRYRHHDDYWMIQKAIQELLGVYMEYEADRGWIVHRKKPD